MENNPIGYAVRFQQSEQTYKHLDILRDYGQVLWGQWRKPGSKSQLSKITKDAMNKNGTTIYAIGQTTVWNMHIEKVLLTEEVKEQELEYLIPSYYDINTECYCWYLIDDIKDYEGKECLLSLFTSSGKSFININQIPGNSPFRVYSTGNPETNIKNYTPRTIPRAYNPERAKITKSVRYDILKRDHFRCVLCGRGAEDGVKLQVDHFIPIAGGGTSEYDNLRTLCEDCNLGKSAKMPTLINGILIG